MSIFSFLFHKENIMDDLTRLNADVAAIAKGMHDLKAEASTTAAALAQLQQQVADLQAHQAGPSLQPQLDQLAATLEAALTDKPPPDPNAPQGGEIAPTQVQPG